jgi:hypothetical protein
VITAYHDRARQVLPSVINQENDKEASYVWLGQLWLWVARWADVLLLRLIWGQELHWRCGVRTPLLLL